MQLTTSKRRTLEPVQNNADTTFPEELKKYLVADFASVVGYPLERLLSIDTPKLNAIYKKHGNTTVQRLITKWVEQIERATSRSCDDYLRNSTASAIYGRFYYFSVGEMICAMAHFVGGQYGHFYRDFEPSILCDAIAKFERIKLIPYRKQCEEIAKVQEEKARKDNAITFAEFVANHPEYNTLPVQEKNLTPAEVVQLLNQEEKNNFVDKIKFCTFVKILSS